MLLQWHIKDPGHSAESAGGKLQLNTHAPFLCGFELDDTVNHCMVYSDMCRDSSFELDDIVNWLRVAWCTQICAEIAALN